MQSWSDANISLQNDTGGGLVGGNSPGGIITDCFSKGSVHGRSNLGGLVGYTNGYIVKSYASGKITGSSYIGGLVGEGL